MWPANGRYEMDVAPAGLGFVHDLLNTIPAGKPREADLLAELGDAQGWLDGALAAWAAETGRQRPEVTLTERDLDQVRALRDEIRGVVTGAEPARELSSATLRLDEDGRVVVEPRGTGARLVSSVVLIEMLTAQQADTWRRLKVCRNPRCQVAFFDRSRNNSGVWHATKVCGNVENLRAHRARAKLA
ncbi:CGNR zinc finger domain-containing protein [Kutzneria kofuensis]|uniref:Putative RNA-binding Zn ribbon-like protein n=1 Tax=Kutzneria kofuensis TaxID=103725 RepID=A0A7W9KDF2_9PSEU|nr:CGNR zinc finger domain-containing protein [Kutzneria kofuensis]MBB5889759.1 putative RNA-binding Zn ribbon-like protein [Kutzneria kofuensis]